MIRYFNPETDAVNWYIACGKWPVFARNIDPLACALPVAGSYTFLHPETGVACGFACLGPVNKRAQSAEVGVAAWQHKEFIPLWISQLLNHMFNVLCYNRITSTPLQSHAAARKHIEAAGFHLESIFRQSACVNGKFEDEVQYVLLKEVYASSSINPSRNINIIR